MECLHYAYKSDSLYAYIVSATFKLLSYNIQVAIPTKHRFHYLQQFWHHLFPHWRKVDTLLNIARTIQPFDIVALQEIDAGSFRSHQIDQLEFLAHHANYQHWHSQRTRNLGKVAQHAKGLLSRYPILACQDVPLPNKIPGRGVQIVTLGFAGQSITIMNAHLSLSLKSQIKQVNYLIELAEDYNNVIMLGDFNVPLERIWNQTSLKHGRFQLATPNSATFPSWKPKKALDAILLDPAFDLVEAQVLPIQFSDHLPIAAEVRLKSS